MPKINNFYLIIPGEIIFIFFLLIILPTIFLKEKPGISQTSSKNTLPLSVKNSYIQQFTTDKNNLNSFSVLLKNPELKSNDFVYLELLNSHKETIQSLKTSGISISDPSWIRFKFSPINSKKGDIFYLKITSNSQKDNLLYIYGDKNTNNINFKTTFISRNIKESFKDNLNQQINNFKSRNIFQTGFYLFTIVLINILILI